jgi:hypothetical protein
MLLALERQDQQPLSGITTQSFSIYEDGTLISAANSKQTLIKVTDKVDHFTLLMVDLGVARHEKTLNEVIAATKVFAERITTHHKIAIFGFDGRARLTQLVDFTQEITLLEKGVTSLSNGPQDSSTNLYGAVVQALELLKERTAKSRKPVRLANLVIVTRGPDRAARVTAEAMNKALEQAQVQRYLVYLDTNADHRVQAIGKDGFFEAQLGVASYPIAPTTKDSPEVQKNAGKNKAYSTGSDVPQKVAGEDSHPIPEEASHSADQTSSMIQEKAKQEKVDSNNETQTAAPTPAPAKAQIGLTLAETYNKIAERIEGGIKKLFLLSYCTPLRAGTHRVRVEVKSGDLSGSTEYEIRADGFGAGCDPNKVPSF